MHKHFIICFCISLTALQIVAYKQCRAKTTTTKPIAFARTVALPTVPQHCVNPYEGLPIEAAVCPEEYADTNFFYISDFYKKIPRCFGVQPIPPTVTTPLDLIKVCQTKHPNALPASIHSTDEMNFLDARSISNALIGLYLPARNDFTKQNMINLDCTPVDFTPIATKFQTTKAISFQLANSSFIPTTVGDYSSRSDAVVLCMTYATPRMPDIWKQPSLPMPDLWLYKCEGEGFHLAAPCGGLPYCYKQISIGNDPGNSYSLNYNSEFNLCGTLLENSFAASEHCEAEHQLLKSFPYTNAIGLYAYWRAAPHRYRSWQWVDRTPFWWIHWDSHSPSNNANPYTEQTQVSSTSDVQDVTRNANKNGICKKPAITKALPIPVKQYDNFTLNGQLCRKEPPMHWNRRCPTDRDDWFIFETESGVNCFLAKPAGVKLTNDTFNHSLCKDVHPDAKLASIHDEDQLAFISSYPQFDIVVGLVYQNGDYVWADGTPVNRSFFSKDQLGLKRPNTVVKIMSENVKRLCADYKDSPCYSTDFAYAGFQIFDMSTQHDDQRILCKIEAEPLVPCSPLPDDDGYETLDTTVCDDNNWYKARLCGKVYCYRRVDIPGQYQSLQAGVENDLCSAMYPGSYLASVHCIEEHFFVQGYPGYTLIGLHIPSNKPFDFKYYQWTDGTPVDFVGWNRYTDPFTDTRRQEPMMPGTSQYGYYGQATRTTRNKNWGVLSGWTSKGLNEFSAALCKKRASRIQTD